MHITAPNITKKETGGAGVRSPALVPAALCTPLHTLLCHRVLIITVTRTGSRCLRNVQEKDPSPCRDKGAGSPAVPDAVIAKFTNFSLWVTRTHTSTRQHAMARRTPHAARQRNTSGVMNIAWGGLPKDLYRFTLVVLAVTVVCVGIKAGAGVC